MVQSRFEKDTAAAKKLYPDLRYRVDKTKNYSNVISLLLTIEDPEGTMWDTFDVEIYFTGNYPNDFPFLREVSEKIPRTADRHMNENGEACVCSKLEEIIFGKKGITIAEFIEQYAIPFLANQIYFDHYKEFKNGDYSHDKKGIIEAYQELLESTDKNYIKSVLQNFLCNKSMNQLCFCGSGEKVKFCHKPTWETLRHIGRENVREHQGYL